MLAGVAAAVTAVVRIAVAHPSATADHSHHVFSVLFAVILTGYIALAVRTPDRADQPVAAPWWGLTAGLAVGVADIGAYPHNGYPDIASYLLSDDITGAIVGGLVFYPLALVLFALIGAAAGARLRQLGPKRTLDTTP